LIVNYVTQIQRPVVFAPSIEQPQESTSIQLTAAVAPLSAMELNTFLLHEKYACVFYCNSAVVGPCQISLTLPDSLTSVVTIVTECPYTRGTSSAVELNVDLNYDGSGPNGEISKEIGDINLAYMLLAQKLAKQDSAAAMYRLGVSRELAELLANMSIAQIVKLANSNVLICGFRLHDHPAFIALGEEKDSMLQQAHMSILMSARQIKAREVGELA